MERYDIIYACGHHGTVELPDGGIRLENILSMQRREDLCPACRAAESDLTGTDRQIVWAEDIRAKMWAEWSRAIKSGKVPGRMMTAFQQLWGSHDAAWWIASRRRSVFALVRDQMMMMDDHAADGGPDLDKEETVDASTDS